MAALEGNIGLANIRFFCYVMEEKGRAREDELEPSRREVVSKGAE